MTADAYTPYPKRSIDNLDQAQAAHDRAGANKILAELRRYRQPREGDTVVGARLEEAIGSGQFARVWRATRVSDGLPCAVKIFHVDKLEQPRMAREFRQGVAAMRRLREFGAPDHIVKLYDADEAHLAFSMEYFPSGDLSQLPRLGWDLSKKLQVFRRLCEAVKFAHEKQVIHRDLKPKNVLLTDTHEPVLADFDLADMLTLSTMTTRSAGTIGYAAPEQVEEGFLPAGARRLKESDVFGLGKVLYFILTERDPPKVYNLDVPGAPEIEQVGLARIERRCTLIDPARRYGSVNGLLADLDLWDSRPQEVGIDAETEAAPHSVNTVEPQSVTEPKPEAQGDVVIDRARGRRGLNWPAVNGIGSLLGGGAALVTAVATIAGLAFWGVRSPSRSDTDAGEVAATAPHARASVATTIERPAVVPTAAPEPARSGGSDRSRDAGTSLQESPRDRRANEWLQRGMGRIAGVGQALPLRDSHLTLDPDEVQLGSFACVLGFNRRGDPDRATHCVGRGVARTTKPFTVRILCSLSAKRRDVACQSEMFTYSVNAATRTGRFVLSLALR